MLQVANAEGSFKLEGPVSKGKQVVLGYCVSTSCQAATAAGAAAAVWC